MSFDLLDPVNRDVAISGPVAGRWAEILTPDALAFLTGLHRRFDQRRLDLLEARQARQARIDAGELPDFLPETRAVREAQWRVAPAPADVRDRRVEITGPVDRKMVINALNSGARVFMADFEDATAPTWSNLLDGQVNLKDRWNGALTHADPVSGKSYRLGERPAVLMVRPRGLHLPEAHVRVDGRPIAGALFDFGLYAFHNARQALAQGSGPYFYIPKLETHLEARLWNDVCSFTESALGLPDGCIRLTVLIETLPAAFEMDEILYELRGRILGLNCGRWDYIFSFIKRLQAHPQFVTPDRSAMTMNSAFLHCYSLGLIQTCHRRGAFAMGGMAAQIPVRGDLEANTAAFGKVRADKEREVRDGHDGTWVAHPDLVPIAMEVFEQHMPGPNQLDRLRDDVTVTPELMRSVHAGSRTEAGMRENIRVGIRYIEAWLGGRGAVPINNLMEDAATVEISRAQLWQWIKFGAALDDGRKVDRALVGSLLEEECAALLDEAAGAVDDPRRLGEAASLFRTMVLAEELDEFLTLSAYERLL